MSQGSKDEPAAKNLVFKESPSHSQEKLEKPVVYNDKSLKNHNYVIMASFVKLWSTNFAQGIFLCAKFVFPSLTLTLASILVPAPFTKGWTDPLLSQKG